MTEYDRRAGLPSANYAQFCLELIAFVAAHPVLREQSRNEQLLAWMDDAAEADRRHRQNSHSASGRLSRHARLSRCIAAAGRSAISSDPAEYAGDGQDNYPYARLTNRLANADAPEQRIDGMFQFANHRPDPPALHHPLPVA